MTKVYNQTVKLYNINPMDRAYDSEGNEHRPYCNGSQFSWRLPVDQLTAKHEENWSIDYYTPYSGSNYDARVKDDGAHFGIKDQRALYLIHPNEYSKDYTAYGDVNNYLVIEYPSRPIVILKPAINNNDLWVKVTTPSSLSNLSIEAGTLINGELVKYEAELVSYKILHDVKANATYQTEDILEFAQAYIQVTVNGSNFYFALPFTTLTTKKPIKNLMYNGSYLFSDVYFNADSGVFFANGFCDAPCTQPPDEFKLYTLTIPHYLLTQSVYRSHIIKTIVDENIISVDDFKDLFAPQENFYTAGGETTLHGAGVGGVTITGYDNDKHLLTIYSKDGRWSASYPQPLTVELFARFNGTYRTLADVVEFKSGGGQPLVLNYTSATPPVSIGEWDKVTHNQHMTHIPPAPFKFNYLSYSHEPAIQIAFMHCTEETKLIYSSFDEWMYYTLPIGQNVVEAFNGGISVYDHATGQPDYNTQPQPYTEATDGLQEAGYNLSNACLVDLYESMQGYQIWSKPIVDLQQVIEPPAYAEYGFGWK